MNDENKSLQTKEETQLVVKTPADMIMHAVSMGANKEALEQVEKMMVLQERYEANEARKAYHQAMATFKETPIILNKDKKVGYSTQKGDVGYSHASLGNITTKINSELSKHGLSVAFPLKQNGQIVVTCRITHKLGHSEETSLVAPADSSGSKNGIQAIGSTITYLERYTLLAMTGMATIDQDDDGQKSVDIDVIEDTQLSRLRDLIDNSKVDRAEERFLKYMKISKVEDCPRVRFNDALLALGVK